MEGARHDEREGHQDSSAWSHLWADGMTRACWQGSLLILGVWLVCRCFPRLPVDARGWLWWLASLKLLLGLGGVPALPLPLLPGGPLVSAGPAMRLGSSDRPSSSPDRARFAGPAAEVALPPRADATSPRAVSPGAGLWMGLWFGGPGLVPAGDRAPMAGGPAAIARSAASDR